MKNILKWSFIYLVFVVGCQPSTTAINTITPPTTSSKESPEAATPTILAEPNEYATLVDLMADDAYLRDCREKYPPVFTEQVGFRGVYPGITTGAEMRKILGKPDSFTEISNGGAFGYSDFNGLVSVKSLIVDGITIDPKSEGLTSLQLVLEAYGCPDVIGARALTDDTYDTSIVFNKTYLWYAIAGVWIRFEGYPIKLSQLPNTIGFEHPSNLLANIVFDERSKPVSFSEAIIEE
jgi:hypothetical protein